MIKKLLFVSLIFLLINKTQYAQDAILWERTYDNGTGLDSLIDAVLDPQNNIYEVGVFNNGSNEDVAILKYDDTGNLLWRQTYDGGNRDMPVGIGIDASNNIYIVTNSGLLGNNIAKILKYNSTGVQQWVKSSGGVQGNTITCMKVMSDGSVYFGGYYPVSINSSAAIVVQYDAAGNYVYTRSYTYPYSSTYSMFFSIDVDPAGNVYAGGTSGIDRYLLIIWDAAGNVIKSKKELISNPSTGNGIDCAIRKLIVDPQNGGGSTYTVYYAGDFYESVSPAIKTLKSFYGKTTNVASSLPLTETVQNYGRPADLFLVSNHQRVVYAGYKIPNQGVTGISNNLLGAKFVILNQNNLSTANYTNTVAFTGGLPSYTYSATASSTGAEIIYAFSENGQSGIRVFDNINFTYFDTYCNATSVVKVLTNSNGEIIEIGQDNTGMYTVKYCTAPVVNGIPTTTVNFCYGGLAYVPNLSTTITNPTVTWNTGYLLSDSTILTPTIYPDPIGGTTTTYSVTVADAVGCSTVEQINVHTYNQLPKTVINSSGAHYNSDATVHKCANSILTLQYWAPYNVSWWDTAGNFYGSTSTSNPIANEGVYYAEISNPITLCTEFSYYITVINDSVSINLGSDTSFCVGNSVTLSGGSGFTNYYWSTGSNASSITVNTTSTVFVSATDTTNTIWCMAKDTININVLPLPTVVANASSAAVCSGDQLTLFGSGATSYSWDNGVTDGVAFVPSATTVYSVTGTDNNGCQNSAQTTVNVGTIDNTTTVSGTQITANEPNATYQWIDCNNGGTYIIGATNQSYTPTTSGSYAVIVTNSYCTKTSSCVIISISSTNPPVYSTQNVTTCNSYASPSGNYTWTTSGTYNDTILAFNGADSIITTNLTINNSSSSSQNITTCNSYTSPSGNYTWTTSGAYNDTISNSVGCDSIITINLTINTVDTSINVNNTMLTCISNSATYQWLDCDNGFSPIAGATNQSFSPTYSGNFAVEITKNTCTDTSSCYHVIITGIAENPSLNKMVIYPNPVFSELTIYIKWISNVKIIDITGKSVISIISPEDNIIDVSQLSKGIYFITVLSDGKTYINKFIKK